MLVTRKSMVTGEEHTLDLPITEEQLRLYEDGVSAQEAFPNLVPAYREFLMTGITPIEWEMGVAGEPEEDGD